MEITLITDKLKEDQLSPPDLAELYTQLAGWYFYYGQMMKKVLEIKPRAWLDLKASGDPKPYSDKMTEMLWEASEDGQKEIALEWELKRIQKMMKAIDSRLYIESVEMKNLK